MGILLDRIKKECEVKGIKNLSQLEAMCEIPPKTIRKWDTNVPSVDRVCVVAKCLDVSVDYLMGKTDIKKPVEPLTPQERAMLDLIRRDPALRAYLFDLWLRQTDDPSLLRATNGTTE